MNKKLRWWLCRDQSGQYVVIVGDRPVMVEGIWDSPALIDVPAGHWHRIPGHKTLRKGECIEMKPLKFERLARKPTAKR